MWDGIKIYLISGICSTRKWNWNVCLRRNHCEYRSSRRRKVITEGVHIKLAKTMPLVSISVVPKPCLRSSVLRTGDPKKSIEFTQPLHWCMRLVFSTICKVDKISKVFWLFKYLEIQTFIFSDTLPEHFHLHNMIKM